MSLTKSTSRVVTMPRRTPPTLPVDVMGMPPNPRSRLMSRASCTVSSGPRHTGSVMKPFSNALTRRTSSACASAGMLQCTTPSPPWSAMPMAMRCSVTVSMGEDTSGSFSEMFRVTRVWRATSSTPKPMWPGSRIRSS